MNRNYLFVIYVLLILSTLSGCSKEDSGIPEPVTEPVGIRAADASTGTRPVGIKIYVSAEKGVTVQDVSLADIAFERDESNDHAYLIMPQQFSGNLVKATVVQDETGETNTIYYYTKTEFKYDEEYTFYLGAEFNRLELTMAMAVRASSDDGVSVSF